MMRYAMIPSLAVAVFGLLASAGKGEDVGPLLVTIRAVGKEGAGNDAAATAWQALVRQGPAALPETLAALDGAGPVATNWLRAAVEAITDKALGRGEKLPADQLEAFLRDTRHAGTARRLAYEALVRVDPATPGRLLPGMLDDPGQELRRDAVAVVLADAQALLDKKDPKALDAYQKALQHARDRDQVTLAADRLKKLGEPVDLTKHYGFLTRWQVIGPFDNRKGVGFAAVYPPEKGVDLNAAVPGQDDKPVRWNEHVTTQNLGVVDFNKVIGPLKGAVAYAYTVVDSPTERPVELRAGSNNAIRISLNGREVYFREEYHHGNQMDQHVGRGTLKAGRNEILVKVCQNEQTDSWAQQWSFQLRVTDAIGGPVPLNDKVASE
jgi:hypothetical protein